MRNRASAVIVAFIILASVVLPFVGAKKAQATSFESAFPMSAQWGSFHQLDGVTIAHKETTDLKAVARAADILIVAIGDPEFITGEYVRPGQVVVDVGINSQNGALVGDVRHSDVESVVQAISPVPGGVGPMTVYSLFENLVRAIKK